MRVDILAGAELDVDALRILAAQRFRAAVIVRPFVADHDHRIAMAHLAVREMAVGIEQHEQRLESERLLEPAEGGLAVLIADRARKPLRSEEQTSELQSLMRISYAVLCLKNKKKQHTT